MQPFDHYSPGTLSEALDLLAKFNEGGRVIAGGTDLLLRMKSGELSPQALIDIKRLKELQGFSFDQHSGLRLGSLVTLRELTRSSIVRENYPWLAEAASSMASEQIRSFATLGGNLCNASPAADLAPPLIASEARLRISSRDDEYMMPVEVFFIGPGRSTLRPGELLVDIHVPPPMGKAIYLKHTPRAQMDIAVVGVAINLIVDGGLCQKARIVLGAVAPVPLRAIKAETCLNGQPLTEECINDAAITAAQECFPIDDGRSAAWYRREMVAVLVRRGLARLSGEYSRRYKSLES